MLARSRSVGKHPPGPILGSFQAIFLMDRKNEKNRFCLFYLVGQWLPANLGNCPLCCVLCLLQAVAAQIGCLHRNFYKNRFNVEALLSTDVEQGSNPGWKIAKENTCFTIVAALSHISESIVGQEGPTMVCQDRNSRNISFRTQGRHILGHLSMVCSYFGYVHVLPCSQQPAF